MTTRPAPKRSALGISHPIEHQQETPRKKIVPTSALSAKRKAAVWADEDVIERIRAAWFHTPTVAQEREVSFSDFLLQAALARAKSREKKFNDGKEFPRVAAGRIGAGRKS